jgi:hypothetical protein
MPVPLLAEGFGRGLSNIPYAWTIIKTIPWIGLIYLLKIYFNGAKCEAERVMHGKVVMVTVSLPMQSLILADGNRAAHQVSEQQSSATWRQEEHKSSFSPTIPQQILSSPNTLMTSGQSPTTSSSMPNKSISPHCILFASSPPSG